MPPFFTHPLGIGMLFVVLSAGPLNPTLHAFGDPQAPPSLDAAARDQLVRRHNELAPRIKMLWRKGKDAKAFAGLKELLALYEQLYPATEFPAGHSHMVRCYRDLCRLSQELEDFDALWHFSHEGLGMCRRLYTPEKFPHGHVNTASMLANVANACMWRGATAVARERLIESIEMSKDLQKNGLVGLDAESVAGLYRTVAATYLREGRNIEALHYTTLSVKQCQNLGDGVNYLDRVRVTARCLLRHGQTQLNVCDFRNATESLQQVLDLRLRAYLADRSPRARLDLIDAHITLASLCRQKSNLPKARWHLRHALREIERAEESEEMGGANRKQRCLMQQLWVSKVDGDLDHLLSDPEVLGELMPTASYNTGDEACDLVSMMFRQGTAYQFKGDADKAEKCFQIAYSTTMVTVRKDCSSNSRTMQILVSESLGDVFYVSGRYRQAYFHFMNALSLARQAFPTETFRNGHRLLSEAASDVATQQWLLGETESAARLYRESMLMNERLYPVADFPRGHRQLMEAYAAWGNVLAREGDNDGAARYFAKALRIAAAQYPEAEYPHGHDELARLWRDLGRLERARGNYDTAFKHFYNALASYERRYPAAAFPDGHLLVALTLSELGRTHLAAGEYGRAEPFFQRSLAMRRHLFTKADYPDGHPSLATALRDLGSLFLASGRYDDALVMLAESARMEQAVAETFVGGGSEALLLNLAARKFQSLDGVIDAWCHTNRPAAEAYEHVWQRRGFVPRLIARRHRALRETVEAGDIANRDAYLKVRRDLSRALLVSASRDPEDDATRLETVRRLNARKESLEGLLTRQLRRFDDRAVTAQADGPRRLAEVMPQGAVLIDYVKYRKGPGPHASAPGDHAEQMQLLAFVIARDQPVACVPMGDANVVEDLARRWREAVLEGRDGGLGTRLRQAIWDPVSRLFPDGIESIYIAPDGALSLIPWNALPLSNKQQFLIERYTIATVPYGQFLLDALVRTPHSAPKFEQVLAVGDLDYGVRPENCDTSTMGLKQMTWRPLRGSGRELDELAAIVGRPHCVRLTGSDATIAKVVELLPTCRWAHFATHGFFVDAPLRRQLMLASPLKDGQGLDRNRSRTAIFRRNPFVRSGLALSDANELGPLDELGKPTEAIGILTAETVAAIDCHGLQLVVLSACESGCGDVVHGDGVFGIQTAFHVAGTRNVIASLWKIDDTATADMMTTFYRLLGKQAMTPAAALRSAQLEMLHRSRTESGQIARGPVLNSARPLPRIVANRGALAQRDLRHWAAFVLSGPGF